MPRGRAAKGRIVSAVLAREADRFAGLHALTPPLQYKGGYLMFSQGFCRLKHDVCEAVWNAIGDIRQTGEFEAMRLSSEL